MKLEVPSGPSPLSCWPPGPRASQGLLGYLQEEPARAASEGTKRPQSQIYWTRYKTLHFNGSRGGGGAMVVNGDAGVDASVLRHHVTDL